MDRNELKRKYPWLVSWTTKEEQSKVEYGADSPYEFGLWTDYMPVGWYKCFGEALVRDVDNALKRDHIAPSDYHIDDVKEKFGSLRWYDNGGEHVDEVIRYYEELSEVVCVECGKPAEWISSGWIRPYCTECMGEMKGRPLAKRGRDLYTEFITPPWKED